MGLRIHKHKPFFLIPIIAMVIFFIVMYKFNLPTLFTNMDSAKAFIQSFGILGPLVLSIMIFATVVLFVLPTTVFVMVGGYLYGPVVGTICSVISILLGSIVVFFLSKKFGRPFVERHMHKKDLQHFDIFFKNKGLPAFFISRLIPIIPNNVVNLTVGLTKIPFKAFFWLTLIGYIPETFVYSMFGEQLLSGTLDTKLIVVMAIAFAFFFIYLYRHKLRVVFIKEVREFENIVDKDKKKVVNEIERLEKDIEKIEKAAVRKIKGIKTAKK